MSVTHHDFTIARTYPYSRAQVFDAWADPAKKAQWYGDQPDFTDADVRYDFRVGGREHDSGVHGDSGVRHTLDAEYTNIVPDERIVYTYSMTLDDKPLSTSVTCVTFEDVEGGTLMTFVEHGVHLDGIDTGEMRHEGWNHILDNLGDALPKMYT
jgi:uncharacterized protein YndB with AHSA1/START domain